MAVGDEAEKTSDPGDAADAAKPVTSRDGPVETAMPAPEGQHGLTFVLAATAVTTAIVTAISYLAPERHAATGVGLGFIAATWWLVLRHDEQTVRSYGLSLGGLLEPTPLDGHRIVRDLLRSASWALLLVAVIFPIFWLGFRSYWHVRHPFVLRLPESISDELAGQVFVIALPEEAFFRGYLQTALDRQWAPRWRVFGANVGPSLIVSAAIFAFGHLLTTPNPARLAVFFPALAFGWLRARTGGIGASVIFHAACNVYSSTLARGYGMSTP